MSQKIDYSKIPEEFKHLPKSEQSRLVFKSQELMKKMKNMPPELLDKLTQDMANLGDAPSASFLDLFNDYYDKVKEAMDEDRKDRRKERVVVEEPACKCDFLPVSYKSVCMCKK